MKGSKCLTVVLGLTCLVFCPALVSAQEGGSLPGFIDLIVDMMPAKDNEENFVNINTSWTDVEGAVSYELIIYDIYGGSVSFSGTENYSSFLREITSGDITLEVVAYNPDEVEIARSPKVPVYLPQPGSVYMGEGSIRLVSEYKHSASNGTELEGREDGAIFKFYIYQEVWEDETGKKVPVNVINGTGSAGFMDTHTAEGYSTTIIGRGQFRIFGQLVNKPPKDGSASCSMVVNLTTFYPTVYVTACGDGIPCQTIPFFDWEESHVIEAFPAVAGASQESSTTVYEEVTKINKYHLESLSLHSRAGCK